MEKTSDHDHEAPDTLAEAGIVEDFDRPLEERLRAALALAAAERREVRVLVGRGVEIPGYVPLGWAQQVPEAERQDALLRFELNRGNLTRSENDSGDTEITCRNRGPVSWKRVIQKEQQPDGPEKHFVFDYFVVDSS